MKNVEGVFWVTVGGIGIASILVIIEMTLHTLKLSIKNKTSFKKAIVDEIKFYLEFRSLVKPVKNKKKSSKSPGESDKSEENKTPNSYNYLPDLTKDKES